MPAIHVPIARELHLRALRAKGKTSWEVFVAMVLERECARWEKFGPRRTESQDLALATASTLPPDAAPVTDPAPPIGFVGVTATAVTVTDQDGSHMTLSSPVADLPEGL